MVITALCPTCFVGIFPAIVRPLAMQQYMLLQRNLVYTGITRGNARNENRLSGLLARLIAWPVSHGRRPV